MVNISTENVLAEANKFLKGTTGDRVIGSEHVLYISKWWWIGVGHGVSIGSETSGWIRNVTFRDSSVDGTNTAVRIKSCRGFGLFLRCSTM